MVQPFGEDLLPRNDFLRHTTNSIHIFEQQDHTQTGRALASLVLFSTNKIANMKVKQNAIY